jgi:DNA-directed RNA polymerase sigma subunit (sigma70/sigma32)
MLTPKDILKRGETVEQFLQLMADHDVTDRQREVIVLRYGLDGKGGKTCQEIAELLDEDQISRQAVSKLELKARKKVGRL